MTSESGGPCCAPLPGSDVGLPPHLSSGPLPAGVLKPLRRGPQGPGLPPPPPSLPWEDPGDIMGDPLTCRKSSEAAVQLSVLGQPPPSPQQSRGGRRGPQIHLRWWQEGRAGCWGLMTPHLTGGDPALQAAVRHKELAAWSLFEARGLRAGFLGAVTAQPRPRPRRPLRAQPRPKGWRGVGSEACGRRRGTQTAAAGPPPAAGWALPREKNRQPAAVSGAPGPAPPPARPRTPLPQPPCVVLGQFPSLRGSRIVLDSVTGTWLAPALPHPAHPCWLAGALCSMRHL